MEKNEKYRNNFFFTHYRISNNDGILEMRIALEEEK